MELNNLQIKEAHQGLRQGKFSSQELVKDCLNAIEKDNQQINAFITVLKKQSLEEARRVDQEKLFLKSPLAGIPLGIKDNILLESVSCTAGSKMLANYRAPYDATVIQKLKLAGAILIGKTNLDEFALGSSSETSYFGPVKNPYDLSRVPGGSSGGSAAALAGRMCLGALGSDTGGSVRQPASFCGLVGFKPSYGMVSRYGLIAAASSLDQIGPLGKSVEDVRYIFDIIRGPDLRDSTTQIEKKAKVNKKNKKIKDLKIGVPRECLGRGLDSSVKLAFENKIKDLEKKGAQIKEVSLPLLEQALAIYYLIMPAEVSANLARYDGIRYGFSQFEKSKNLFDFYLKSRSESLGEEVKRRIILGTYSLSAGHKKDYYLRAQKIRTLLRKSFDDVFNQNIDCLISPTTPTPAFALGEKKDNPLAMYLSDVLTVPVNLASLPAISLPFAREKKDLPIGWQIIGNYLEDDQVLEWAQLMEE